MTNTNDLRNAFNNIGTEVSWEDNGEIGVAGMFIITDINYQSLTAMNHLARTYIGDEYPEFYSKYYSGTNEYKFEYQSAEFLR